MKYKIQLTVVPYSPKDINHMLSTRLVTNVKLQIL